MKQLYYILLAVVALFGAAQIDSKAQEQGRADWSHSVVAESVDRGFSEELICCRECNSDMLLRTSRTIVTVGQNNLTSLSNSVRSRHESHHKSLAQAFSESHAGRVTRFFEFNHFRSSLRVVYYLYALCRLRI